MRNFEPLGRELKERIAERLRKPDKGIRCCPVCFRWHNHAQILQPPIPLDGMTWKYEKCPDCVLSAEHGA